MKISLYPCSPERMTTRSGNKCTLAGMRFKHQNFLLFKLIRSYWLLNEVAGNDVVAYHTVLFEVEIRPFWKNNKH